MPSHKNQHFVPRCHMAPFSNDSDGKSIRTILLPSCNVIEHAAIKDQCSRAYFYGRDLEIETILGSFEGLYKDVIRRIENSTFDQDDLSFLRNFSYLQYNRTLANTKRLQVAYSNMAEFVRGTQHEGLLDTSQLAMTRNALEIYTSTVHVLADLHTVIVHNTSPDPFITSDDPTSFNNRYYNIRLGKNDFAVASAGLIISMPLTPRHVLLSFDSNIYYIEGEYQNLIETSDVHDVMSLNGFHVIRMTKCLYIPPSTNADRVISLYDELKDRRQYDTKFAVLGLVSSDRYGKRYREIPKDSDPRGYGECIIQVGTQHPKPKYWPSFLKNRAFPKSFSNGSAVGHVRKREWLKGRP